MNSALSTLLTAIGAVAASAVIGLSLAETSEPVQKQTQARTLEKQPQVVLARAPACTTQEMC